MTSDRGGSGSIGGSPGIPGPVHPVQSLNRGPSRRAAAVAAAGVLVAALIVTAVIATSGSAATVHPGARVVAIGDSIMDGHGLEPSQSWPAIVAKSEKWSLSNLATDGAGFVTLGNFQRRFRAQVRAAVKLKPSIVLISSSSNDLGDDDLQIAADTRKDFDRLRKALPHATILAFSAFWGDTAVPAQLTQIDADVKSAALAVGGTWIDIGQPLAGRRDLMQGDDVHPTAGGQSILASVIRPKVVATLRAH